LRGKGQSIVNYRDMHSAVICAKTAEPIEMPFGIWTRVASCQLSDSMIESFSFYSAVLL